MISGPGQVPRKHANTRYEDPGLGAGDGLLEVLGEASAAIEPSKCSLDHPAFSLGLEGADALGSCDDLDGPLAELDERLGKLFAPVHAVSKDVAQLGKDETDVFQQWHRAVDVLDIGRPHLHGKQ